MRPLLWKSVNVVSISKSESITLIRIFQSYLKLKSENFPKMLAIEVAVAPNKLFKTFEFFLTCIGVFKKKKMSKEITIIEGRMVLECEFNRRKTFVFCTSYF